MPHAQYSHAWLEAFPKSQWCSGILRILFLNLKIISKKWETWRDQQCVCFNGTMLLLRGPCIYDHLWSWASGLFGDWGAPWFQPRFPRPKHLGTDLLIMRLRFNWAKTRQFTQTIVDVNKAHQRRRDAPQNPVSLGGCVLQKTDNWTTCCPKCLGY